MSGGTASQRDPAIVIPLEKVLSLDLADLEQRLRVAFLARYGPQLGAEVAAEAMAWAWENRDRLETMENPAGYLFRVGQSKSKRLFRWRRETVRFPDERSLHSGDTARDRREPAWTEPKLSEALNRLGKQERTAVILVHCFQWTYDEVGEMLDLPLHTVRNRIHRGLTQLRADLGANQS